MAYTEYVEDYSAMRKKEQNPAIYNNMDGPWVHNAKCSKSDRKRQMLYELI